MTASVPEGGLDLTSLAGVFEARVGWSSGARRAQLLGLSPHLDLAAALAADCLDSAARRGRTDPVRAAEDLGRAVAQLEALTQTLSAFRVEVLALAAEDHRRRPETDPEPGQ